jgi:hypothetical protein
MNAIKLCITLLVSVVIAVSVASHSEAATTAGVVKIDMTGNQFLVQMQSDQSVKKCTYDSGTAKFNCVDIVSAGPNFLYQGAVDISGNNISDAVFMNIAQGDKGDVTFWPDFAKAQAVTPRQARTLWRADSVGDMDGDGVGDVAWRFTGQTPNFDDTGVSYIWFMNRDGTVAQVRKRGGAPLSWKILGSADLNNDGAADTVFVSPTNAIRVLMATPNRTCANFSAGQLDPNYVATHFASFTFATVPDVLARNTTTGAVRLTTLNASGIALPAYTGAPDDPNASCTSTTQVIPQVLVRDIPSDPTWQIYATGDFNNDGIIDIVWKKPDGVLAVWFMSPSGNAPVVNNNAGNAPLGFVGLSEQSGNRTNNAESVTYVIWTGNYPYQVTKTGVTKVVNKTQFQAGALPLYSCALGLQPLADGKVLTQCRNAIAVNGIPAATLVVTYINRSTGEMLDYSGTVPSNMVWVLSANNADKPEWGAKARVAGGWYYTKYNETSVLRFQSDSGDSFVVKQGTFAADGDIKVIVSYSN